MTKLQELEIVVRAATVARDLLHGTMGKHPDIVLMTIADIRAELDALEHIVRTACTQSTAACTREG